MARAPAQVRDREEQAAGDRAGSAWLTGHFRTCFASARQRPAAVTGPYRTRETADDVDDAGESIFFVGSSSSRTGRPAVDRDSTVHSARERRRRWEIRHPPLGGANTGAK